MLKTTRRFFSTLALRYCALMSAGWVQVALVASSYQAFSGCSASGLRAQKARRVDTGITRMGRSLVPKWDLGKWHPGQAGNQWVQEWVGMDVFMVFLAAAALFI